MPPRPLTTTSWVIGATIMLISVTYFLPDRFQGGSTTDFFRYFPAWVWAAFHLGLGWMLARPNEVSLRKKINWAASVLCMMHVVVLCSPLVTGSSNRLPVSGFFLWCGFGTLLLFDLRSTTYTEYDKIRDMGH